MVKRTTYVIAIAFLTFFLIVPFISYKSYKSALEEKVFNHLINARDILELQIWNYFRERYGDIDVLSRNPTIAQSITQFAITFHNAGVGSSQFRKIMDIHQPIMEFFVSSYGYVDIFLVNQDGDVLFSARNEKIVGTNLLTEENEGLSITQIFKSGMDDVNFEDYSWNEEVNDFTSYFAAPVLDDEKLLGVLIIEIPFYHLDKMLTQRAGLGETGEMYLVGEDGLMRSNSRFSEEPTILQKEVDTKATREAAYGYSGTDIIEDYRGVSVLSAYVPLHLNYINWTLLVEIDEAEAFAPIRYVETRLIIIASIIGAIAIGYLYFTYKIKNIEDKM